MAKKRMPKEVAEKVILRSEDMVSWGACETAIPGICSGVGEQIHHRQLRSQGGEHTAQNCIFVCHDDHLYIHGHPAESYRNGWIVHGFDYPEDEPVLRRGRWVLLHEDGTMTEVEKE